MKKITQPQLKKFLNFMEENKYMVGLHGWKMLMKPECFTGESLAACEPNIYEQTLVVELNDDFLKLDEEQQESILIHELVHGRINIFQKIVEELVSYEEERLANDLERGFYSLYKKTKKD